MNTLQPKNNIAHPELLKRGNLYELDGHLIFINSNKESQKTLEHLIEQYIPKEV